MKTFRYPKFAKVIHIVSGCFLSIFMLTACSSVPPKKPPESLVQKAELSPRELMEKYPQKDIISPPKLPLEALGPLTPFEPQIAMEAEFPFEKKLFSIEVIDEPLGNVLLGLAMAADLNLILGQDVDRYEPVSVKIKNLPLKAALDSIITTHNYFYTIEKSILHVEGLKTEFFTVDYPLVYSKPDSETGGDVLGGGGGGGGGGGETGTGVSSSGLKGEFTIEVEVEDDEELDVWKKIDEALKTSKSGERGLLSEQGKAEINRMAGTIVVTDRPKNLKTVAEFIDRINEALHRQVIIEAKIVEVALNKGHKYGIDWEFVSTSFGTLVDVENPLRFFSIGATGGDLTAGFFDTVGDEQGQAVLNALATQGDVNVLSSPRLNVVNNQTGLISVGRVIPYIDLQITTTDIEVGDTPTVRTSAVPVIVRTLEGVTLGITPQISDQGDTTLHIVPIITEQTGNRPIRVENETFVIPIFSVRESDTMVSVADGQTIVIGGLIQEKTDDTVSKIPLLGDIPLLNVFFSKQERETNKTELVILLTTSIVK